jgi:hypothetical protein
MFTMVASLPSTPTYEGLLLHFPGVELHHYDTTMCFSAFGAFSFTELRGSFYSHSTVWATYLAQGKKDQW